MQIRLLPEDLAAIEAAKQRSGSANTKRGYEGAWRRFTAWCEGRDYPALPTAGRVLAAYLLFLGREGKAVATITLHRAAVVHRHKITDLAHPADSKDVRDAMRYLEESLGRQQKQAKPLHEEARAEIHRTAKIPRRRPDGTRENLDDAMWRGAEDIALILVMHNAMLRKSEAAALVWDDVRPTADGKGHLYVRRSKTDQRAAGSLQHLGRRAMKALEAIRPLQEAGQPVFIGRDGTALKARQLSNRIKDAAKAAGLGEGYSGHSPRVGAAIDLYNNGSGLPALQREGRWIDPKMVERYTRQAESDRGAMARYEDDIKAGEEAGRASWNHPGPETGISQTLFNNC